MEVKISKPLKIEGVVYKIIVAQSEVEYHQLKERYNLINEQYKEEVILYYHKTDVFGEEVTLMYPEIDFDLVVNSDLYTTETIQL